MNIKQSKKFITVSILLLTLLLTISHNSVAGNIPSRPPVIQIGISSIASAGVDESNNATEIAVKEFSATGTFGKSDTSFGILTYGINYKQTRYSFDNINAEDKNLHSLSIPLTLINSSNDWTYVGKVSPGVDSDFENLDENDFSLAGMFTAIYKKSDNLTWVMGLGLDRSFGDTKAYPIGGANYTPNDNWLLELVFPRFKINYGPSADYFLFWTLQPTGNKWNVEANSLDRDFNITTKAWRTSVGGQFNVSSRVWINVEGGIEANRTIEFADDSGLEEERDFKDAGFVAVNLYYYIK